MTELNCLLGSQSPSCETVTLILRIKYYSHEPYFPTTSSQFVINVAEKEGFEPHNMTNTLAGYSAISPIGSR